MKPGTILDYLKDVCRIGANTYTARCPIHADSSARLLVRLMDDGRPVLFCHSKCKGADIFAATGADFDDLHSPALQKEHFHARILTPFTAEERIAALHECAQEASFYADQMSRGFALTSIGQYRMHAASNVFATAHEYGKQLGHQQWA